MLHYAVISTGSQGNCFCFWSSEPKGLVFLVDMGVSPSFAAEKLAHLGLSLDQVSYLFITHSHADHIKGLRRFLGVSSARVVIGKEIALSMELSPSPRFIYVELLHWYCHENLRFVAFPTSHDSVFNCSYRFEFCGLPFMILTDTGAVLPIHYEMACGVRLLFLETNYSIEGLRESKDPPSLKRRIASDRGHLSNLQAAEFLKGALEGSSLQRVYLCHASARNNAEETALKEVTSGALKRPVPLVFCRRGVVYSGVWKGETTKEKSSLDKKVVM